MDLNVYSDALVLLGTAGIVVPIVRRAGISPVLGYLVAGAVLGPLGLGAFKDQLPALRWVTVVDAKSVSGIAELGVVFLLFVIGLELSFERLKTMRRLVLGLGGLQVLISTAVIAAVCRAFSVPSTTAVIIGGCLALSSTAIVLETLSGQGRLASLTGRASFAVLLAQDLAVIPLLLFISAVGGASGHSAWLGLGSALLQAAVVLGVIVLLGRTLVRPLFHLVASVHSTDLFVAAALFVVVGAAVLASAAGVSMALGAFVAGLLLAGTEFDKAIKSAVEPFRGLLLGMFFFTVGMGVDFHVLVRDPLPLIACAAGLIVLKCGVLTALARAFRLPWASGLEMGLLLGPGGEFAFVGIAAAAGLGLLGHAEASFLLVLTTLTMTLIPPLSLAARRLRSVISAARPDPELAARPAAGEARAIVVGYGRVGSVVCEMLARHGIAFLAIDRDPGTVAQARRAHGAVYYGNAADPEFLKVCGIGRAPGVVLTLNDAAAMDEIIRVVRILRPDIPIVARARDADHARRLYLAGVTEAAPETIEASLQLSEAALVSLGVAMGPAIASIHDRRAEFREELQAAARGAGA